MKRKKGSSFFCFFPSNFLDSMDFGFSRFFDKLDPFFKFSIKTDFLAGENALFFPKRKYKQALELKTDHQRTNTIWKITGIEFGKDKKPRFEIDDKNFYLKTENLGKENITLKDIFHAPEFYKNYPEAQNIKINYKSLTDYKTLGSYNKENNIIEINKISSNKEDLKLTVLHEIQHYIQHKENFNTGTSTNKILYSSKLYKEGGKDFINLINYYEKNRNDLIKFVDTHNKLEILERFGPNGPNYYIDSYNRLLKGYDSNSLYEKYKRKSGEVEARNVSFRTNLKNKKNIPPSKTEDIKRPFQLLKDHGNIKYQKWLNSSAYL